MTLSTAHQATQPSKPLAALGAKPLPEPNISLNYSHAFPAAQSPTPQWKRDTGPRIRASLSEGHAALNPSLSRETLGVGIDVVSNGLTDRTVSGHRRKQTPRRDGKDENRDWLAGQFAQRTDKDVIASTAMTGKAVQNIRQRRSKISFDNLVDLCRNDPDFAAAFGEHIGLLRPGEAEIAGALTQAFNAYMRTRAP